MIPTRRCPWALLLPLALALPLASPSAPRAIAPAHERPIVRQTERHDCGPAVLAMLMQSFGHGCSLEDAKQRLPYRVGGATLQALIDAAGEAGLRLRGLRLNLAALRNGPFPAVARVEPEHYVIVDGVDRRGDLVIRDPARGHRTLAQDRFLAIWDGIVLVSATSTGAGQP